MNFKKRRIFAKNKDIMYFSMKIWKKKKNYEFLSKIIQIYALI